MNGSAPKDMNYPIIIEKDKNSDYGVTVPDLPGCYSAGSTLNEAIENAREAILLHIEGLLEDEEIIPEPSNTETFKNIPKNAWQAIATVDLTQMFGNSARINISFPRRILLKVDRFAKKQGKQDPDFS